MSLARAIETGDLAELPSRRDEDWRWTDLRGLIRTLPAPSQAIDHAIQSGGPFKGLTEAELVIGNGRMNWWPGRNVGGVHFWEHQSPDAPVRASQLPMAAWAARTATSPGASILTFERGGVASLRLVSDAQGTSHHARIGVMVKAGVSAVLVESHEGLGADYLTNDLLEIYVEKDARLERIVIVEEAADAIAVSTADVRLSSGAVYRQTIVTSGAKRQRAETHVTHPGAEASVRMDGLYVVSGRRHADITTVVTHEGVEGTTDQLTKGVVRDQARGIFQGRITVQRGADRTDARMGHHALVLSDRAEVDAKPELEIYADDVACAHGNTVGALDEDALFYAEQRGIPEEEARAMLTEAFVGEVVDRIEHDGAREVVRAWVADKLRAAA